METVEVGAIQQRVTQELSEFTCGYEVRTGTYAQWAGGYQAWVRVSNVEGEVGTDFSIFLDLGGEGEITNLYLADYEEVEGGYLASAPSWLEWQKIRQGQTYEFAFVASGEYQGVTPYVISINGVGCDTTPPEVTLGVESTLVTSSGGFLLEADATDGAGVRKVVFTRDGEVLGEDTEAPYSWEVELDEGANGRHEFAATAVDYSGNEASDSASVLIAIGNRFLGTAVSSASDYATTLPYFSQITPENAGKWGSVEATRDEYDWAALDEAAEFAEQNGLVFRMHTLVWGQQEPAWVRDLSPEEQLEEVEEWMSAVAERYPDLDTVDVVNEPLHAPPSYAEALGGAGETGWDWVIRSFELAREYFPNSELILNDYQILLLDSFTQDYLEIVQLLQDRGLIDGIGEQGHFLERAEIPVVEANLAALTATGLPIYITEFDVNFADDARHANALKDLFTVFWNEPAVLGVTHWGHLQGDVWQPNAYLIRDDGTFRPGFDWLLCTVGGGTDCTVPEYVPAGWQGGEYGLTMEAELYDQAQGLVALGNTVAYTDDGDWLEFVDVQFQDNWDTFSVTYAKGNEEVGSISILLDSLESEPILTVELPPTAGWGTSATIEVPWPPIGTTHDVYVTFNDVYGVANIDQIRFGTEPPQTGVNLVEDPGLESGEVGGWAAWYGGGTVSTTAEAAHSGTYSLVMTNRTGTSGYSPIYHLPTASIAADTTYAVSVWAAHNNTAGTDTLRLSGIINCAEDLGHNAYPWIRNLEGVAANTWTQLSGTLTVPAGCTPTEVAFYLEGTSANVDIFVDDAVFINPNIIPNPGFEQGNFDGWDTWYAGGVLGLSEAPGPVYSGDYSLALTGRNEASGFNARYRLPLDQLVPGTTYSASLFASHNGAGPETLRLAAVVQCANPPEGHNAYPWIQSLSDVAPGEWVQLTGSLPVPDCDPTEVAIYVEGPSANVDVFLDNAFFGAP